MEPMTAYGDVSQYGGHSFPVAAGDWFSIEFWARANGYALGPGDEGISSPQMNFQSASGTYIGSIQGSIPVGTYDWTFFRVSGQVPENATKASLIAVWGKLVTGTVDIDAIRMYKGAPSQQTVGANLLLNPDFERALEQWEVEVPLVNYSSIQTGGAKSGNKFLRIAGGQSIAASVKHSYNGSGFYPVVEGQSFKFEGWFRTSSAVKAVGNNLFTQVGFYNAAQTYLGGFVFSYPEGTTSTWTHLTAHGVAPAGSVYLSFFAFIGKLASGSIDIDSLQFYFEDAVEKTPIDYGALGDGVTDDTLAVQNAINDNISLKIPAGYTFLVNGLSVSGKTSPYIYGGGTLKQKANAPAGSSLLLVTNCVEPYVEGIVMDGNKTSQPNAVDHLLYFSNCTGTITADAVMATNGKSGGIMAVSASGAGVPSSVVYNGCTVTGCTTGLGIQNNATAGLVPVANITDCIATGNSVDGISAKRVTDIAISTTLSTSNTGYGVTADTCAVRFSDCNLSGNTAGGFNALGGSTHTAYNTVGMSDVRVPIAPPPSIASLAFSVTDLGSSFGFDWSWTNPATLGTAIGTIRQVRYYAKSGSTWVLDSDWITTGQTIDTSTLTATDGPFEKRSGEFKVEGRIATLNYETTKSAWITTTAPLAIGTLPIDSELENVNLNTNYNGSGYKVVSKADGTLDVTVEYGPPYPAPPSRVTNLIAAIPIIELADGSVLSYPSQPYTSNPGADVPDNLQTITVNMSKPSAPTTIYYHVLSVSTNGQLAYKDHTLANPSSWIAIAITQTEIDSAASTDDAPVAPLTVSVSVDSSAPDVFSLTPSWALPTNKGGNVGYVTEVQYLDTPTGTLTSTDWQAPTPANENGKNTTSVTIGPFARQSVDRYVFSRVKAINGNGQSSAWVTMSGSGALVPQGTIYQTPSDISGFSYTVGGNNYQFTFVPSFTAPTDPAIIGYQVQARFYLDSGASTTPDSEWIDLGNRLDITDLSPFGPFDRANYVSYSRLRIRSMNATGGTGNWITSSTIGTINILTAPPAPQGVTLTLATTTKAGSPVWRSTVTINPATVIGTSAQYSVEVRVFNDAAMTSPDSEWAQYAINDKATTTAQSDWWDWDKVTKYVRARVCGINQDGTYGSYTYSTVQTLSASAGLDLSAADTSKVKGLEVVGGKLQVKLNGTDLAYDPATGAISQNVVDMLKAQNFDTSIFSTNTGVFKQKAIEVGVLLAGLVATNSLIVGGGTSNVTVSPTSVTISGGGNNLAVNSTGVVCSLVSTGAVSFTGSIDFFQGGLRTAQWSSTGFYTGGTLSASRVYGVQWGDITSKPTIVTSVNGQTGAVTVSAGSTAWADITGKPTFGGAAYLSVGTSSGTVCAGDDSRLSNARTPTSHKHSVNTEDVEVRMADGSTRWIKAVSMTDPYTGYTGS
ncbi:MAG: glycosyl hydrolase family 28-related protein [Paludibaculum sp.]